MAKAIYNIYLHPLAKFPGDKWSAATKLPVVFRNVNGDLPRWLHRLHGKYQSGIVRISPDELSVISPAAWDDLYAQRQGHKAFQKDHRQFVGIESIVNANDADHRRLRRILAHAFSDKALREQEPLIQSHVDIFLEGLDQQVKGPSKGKVNISLWYNWFTFDIIGDLAFGESFDCLKNEKLHPWVSAVIDALQAVVWMSATMQFPPLDRFLTMCIPKNATKGRNTVLGMSAETVKRRLSKDTDRKDFLSYILQQDAEKGMSMEEIHGNAASLVVAGGETSSGSLTGTTYYLLKHPRYYEKLVQEIRESYKTKSDVNIQSVLKLPYFQAVMEESFRIYPPAVNGQPRKIPAEGGTVAGYWIPGGTSVQLNQYPANHSATNFKDPENFVPDRWLGDERYESDQRNVMQPFSVGARNCIGKK